jgi:putative ABC transport system substrate-binding protein
VLFSVFPLNADLHGADSRAPKVAVLVSREIRPYLEAVEGISAALAEGAKARIESFSLEKINGKGRTQLRESLQKEMFDLMIAVGPEAVKFVSEEAAPGHPPWLYSMVLNPPRPAEKTEISCGVGLDIPAPRQLEMIALGLSSVKRLGLLYDPRYNADFFGKAAAVAASGNLKVVPLPVSSKKDIPTVLKQNWANMDALWLIPDQTVISESIVQYIIKEALFKKTPVIGYNRFFYESGAALAFVFAYEEIGRQTGKLAAGVLQGKACEKEIPVFHVWQNLRMLNKLGISVPEKKTPPVEAGP